MASLYGDGRLTVGEYDSRETGIARHSVEWRLSPEALDAVQTEIAGAQLQRFSNEIARSKEAATGRPIPTIQDAGPAYFTISWLDQVAGTEPRERSTTFVLTYGGMESTVYPEIPEYQAAQRIILRLLKANDQECSGCKE
ncbi:MAG: hypothetical protein ABI639_09190 [Thermoanaerobaculia bacterium]